MKKRILKIISVSTGTIALSFLYDYLKELHIFITAGEFLRSLALIIFRMQIKLWPVLLGASVVGAGLYLFKRRRKPPYTYYKRNVFREWLWKWSWAGQGDEWKVINLRPYCPSCEVQLKFETGTGNCPGCDLHYNKEDEPEEEIIRLIMAMAD